MQSEPRRIQLNPGRSRVGTGTPTLTLCYREENHQLIILDAEFECWQNYAGQLRAAGWVCVQKDGKDGNAR